MKKRIISASDPYGFEGAANENRLSTIARLGRKLGLIATDIDDCLGVLEVFQNIGYSDLVENFTDDELSILGQASEILMTKSHQLTKA